jgi:hypothetical protein
MTIGHIGADESRKGGVSVLGVMLRVCQGNRHQDLMLDCSVIDDQQAETEFQAMLDSFKVEIGEWVVEVPIQRIVSGISDNAKGAVKVLLSPPIMYSLYTKWNDPPPPPPLF